jgi:tetratricopeptide (TPR) repeat protein
MSSRAGFPRFRFALAALGIALAIGCSERAPSLVPVPAVDTSTLEPSVRTALTRARAEFDRVANAKPKEGELANAYGELAMVYHAQNLVPAAAAAYTDARALAPRDKRWAYLQGHLYNDSSRVPEALAAFEAALAIDGNDPAILFSLGQVYLQRGDFDKAQAMFDKLQSTESARAAAVTGLGKIALARHQYKEAAAYLEKALKLSPDSTRLRQPLAMAYQALGERAKAEENLKQYTASGTEPEVSDPIVDELGTKIASAHVLVRRGQRLSRVGQFDLAESVLRRAVAADPTNADALANLGITLTNLGRLDEAQQRLTEALALDDRNAFAHLTLGVVFDRQGQDQAAIKQYAAALERDPANVQAMVYLADVKMREGLAEDAAKLYREALDRTPDSTRIRLSLALAQVKAKRYAEARKELEAALKAQPKNPEITNMLARLLASAPLAAIRDGPRALELAQSLFETTKHPEVGQTYAMALAETGHFDQAIALQRETIIVFERTGHEDRKPFLERNLALYEHHKATREGWDAADPIFQPRSPAVRAVAKNP